MAINTYLGNNLYYRDHLNDVQKTLYDDIYNAICNSIFDCTVGVTGFTDGDLLEAMRAIFYDCPQLYNYNFHIDALAGITYYSDSGRIILASTLNRDEGDSRFVEIVNEVFEATQYMNDYEKLVYVYDYVLKDLIYPFSDFHGEYQITDETYDCFTMYGALINKKAVDPGIALAMVYLLYQIGINSRVVKTEDTSNVPHNFVVAEINDGGVMKKINLVPVFDTRFFKYSRSLYFGHGDNIKYPKSYFGFGLTDTEIKNMNVSSDFKEVAEYDDQYFEGIESDELSYYVKRGLSFSGIPGIRTWISRSCCLKKPLILRYTGKTDIKKVVRIAGEMLINHGVSYARHYYFKNFVYFWGGKLNEC